MLRAEPPATPAVQRRGRSGWVDTLGATAALLTLLAGYSTVVTGTDWYVSTALVCLLVATATIVLRQLGARRVVAPVALVTEIVVLAWVFVPSTLLVLVPTSATVAGFRDLIESAGPIIANEQAPVAPSSSVVLVLAAAFGALVVVADALVQLRFGVTLLGGLLLAVYIAPSLIAGMSPSAWLFVPAAAMWLVLLRRRTAVDGAARTARQAPAVVVGLGGLLAAVLFPVVSPDIGSVASSWGNPPPQVFGRGINPIVELGTNLRRNTPVPVLTYTTTLEDPPYLKVATLPDFTGRTWRPSDDLGDGRFEGRLAVDEDVSAEGKLTRISISQLRSDLLPVPYPTVDIEGFEGGFRVERTGLTVQTRGSNVSGQEYTTESLEVLPTADQLRAAIPRVTPDLERYVELDQAPPIIFETASEVTRDANTTYDRVLALQDWFRSGEFEYSETAPVAEDYDGTGLGVIAEFLQRRSGYCVHFSSAMAVMARSLNIPARVAVGYAPGSPSGDFEDGRRVYEVLSDDLHAWTEVYFEGIGWVRFDPTPGIGEGTAFSDPTSGASRAETPQDTPENEPQQDAQSPRGEDGAIETVPTDESTSTAPRSAVVVAVALLLVVGLPGAVRRGRRAWRLRDPDPGRAWREIEDTARDFGVETSVADTPRGLAGRLAARPGVDPAALDRLLQIVERRRFSRSEVGGDGCATDARAVIASLRTGASRSQRWRATVLPRSLGPRPLAVTTPAATTPGEAPTG